MRVCVSVFLLSVGLVQNVQATPSRYVEMREELLGWNDTHLFLLRSVEDNLGFHSVTLSETYLISRDLRTGADERAWPVMWMMDHGRYYFQDGYEERVENLNTPDRVSPFDILLWRKAYRCETSDNFDLFVKN